MFTKLPEFVAWAELILQAFSHFTYVTAHSDSPSFPSLHLRHSSFSNPSLALPTSQLILQPFRCFTYVTAHSTTLLSPLLRHRIFTYVTWRAAHGFTMQEEAKLWPIPNPSFLFQSLGFAANLATPEPKPRLGRKWIEWHLCNLDMGHLSAHVC